MKRHESEESGMQDEFPMTSQKRRVGLLSLGAGSSTLRYLLLLFGSILCNLLVIAALLTGVQRNFR